MKKTFEYKILENWNSSGGAEEELNRYGELGWELVNVIGVRSTSGIFYKAFLKREIEQ